MWSLGAGLFGGRRGASSAVSDGTWDASKPLLLPPLVCWIPLLFYGTNFTSSLDLVCGGEALMERLRRLASGCPSGDAGTGSGVEDEVQHVVRMCDTMREGADDAMGVEAERAGGAPLEFQVGTAIPSAACSPAGA